MTVADTKLDLDGTGRLEGVSNAITTVYQRETGKVLIKSFADKLAHAALSRINLDALIAEHKATKDRLQELEAELRDACDLRDTYGAALKDLQDDDCVRSARQIAEFLARELYPEAQFKPFDGIAGLLSQIDNMVAGLPDRAVTAEAQLARAKEGLDDIGHGYGVNHTSKWARDRARSTLQALEQG